MTGARRKRGPRPREKDKGVGAYLLVDFVGHARGAEALRDAVQIALCEAYGEVGSARYEVVVCNAEATRRGVNAVLHAPHADQRRAIWAALTLLASMQGSPARFLVLKHADGLESLNVDDESGGMEGHEKESA